MEKPSLIITCRHNNPNKIIETLEGEYVCKCGVILEEKLSEEGFTTVQSRVPLYHQVENGGDPKDMKVINKKIHVYASRSSEFSNICNKLVLPDFVQKRSWSIYRLLRNKTYFSRAKCAAFSIYTACRECSCPVDESQIQTTVCSILCVKNVPNMLSVISEMHDEALNIGINTNEGHSSNYYLNLAISRKQHIFSNSREYDRFAKKVINNMTHVHGNHRNKVKRAVFMSLCEMGRKCQTQP